MMTWPITQVPMLPRPPFSWLSAWVIAIVAHWCCACHHRSGTVNATAMAAPAPNHRFSTIARPPDSRTPATRAAANRPALCLLASPRPRISPAASHQRQSPVRPIRITTRASAVQASMSYGVVLARWLAASRAGMVPVPTAASSCARRPPPSSRAVRPLITTVAPAASAGHSRSPGSDMPNSFSETQASSGVSTG